ncbi:hypothetical protein IW150_001446 [Coemansia sp. RSA 2607]|nr:hypothetical protein IW150_001446 [Coemansia sp. RSA 2607]
MVTIAIAKAQEKHTAVETASSSGATVPAAIKPCEYEKPITREKMHGYQHSMDELQAMIECLVIVSPVLGAAVQTTKMPSPDGPGGHFGYDNAPLFTTPVTMVPELVSYVESSIQKTCSTL